MKKFLLLETIHPQALSPTIFNYWFKKYKINAKYGFIEYLKAHLIKKIKNS